MVKSLSTHPGSHARKHSAEANAAQSARMRGKHHPHKGHPQSAATRALIGNKLRGKHHGSGSR